MSLLSSTLDKIKDVVSTHNLRLLYDELVRMASNKELLIKQQEGAKGIVSTIINFLVEAEKSNKPDILELFCELNFIQEFIALVDLDEHNMNLTVIESFSFLCVNLSTTEFLYYLLSNNFINLLISKDYHDYDDNFFSYYISFIKSLALRLDQTTIQFFYQSNVNSFPLVECSISLYNFNDPMIRTCVRAILLTILKVNSEAVQDHFIQLPTVEYFIHLSLHLRDLVINLNTIKNSPSQSKWNNAYEDIIDEIRYVRDILKLHQSKINYVLINSLYHYLIIPLLFKPLMNQSEVISKEISLIILKALFEIIDEEGFAGILFCVLYTDTPMSAVLDEIDQLYRLDEEDIGDRYYSFTWVKQLECKGAFVDFISRNYTYCFFLSLIYENNMNYKLYTGKYPQLQIMKNQVREEIDNNITLTPLKIEEMVHTHFFLEDYKTMRDYHQSVSNAIGIKVGLTVPQENKMELNEPCFLSLIRSLSKMNKGIDFKQVNNIKSCLYNSLETNNAQSVKFYSYILLYSGIKKHYALTNNQESNESFIKKNDSIEESKQLNALTQFEFNHLYSSQEFLQVKIKTHFAFIDKLLKASAFSLRLIVSELIMMNIYSNVKDNPSLSLSHELKQLSDHILTQIFTQTIAKIKESIQASHTIRENGFEYFKQQWTEYSTLPFTLTTFNNSKEKSSNLNPNLQVNPIKDYLQVLRNKSNDIETFKYYLLMYMKLNDLRLVFNTASKKSSQPKPIQSKFPLEVSIRELEIDQVINLSNVKEIDIVQKAQLKVNSTETDSIVILIYFSFLYFGFYDHINVNGEQNVVIVNKYSLRNASLQKDANDEKCLNLLVMSNSKSTELSLLFSAEEEAKDFIWKLSDRKLAVINNEKMMFLMYFQEMD